MRHVRLTLGVCAIIMACTGLQHTYTSVPVLLEYQLYYPDDALEQGLEGVAVLYILIDEAGRVVRADVHTTSGYPVLDSAAVRTAKSFVFSPALYRDQPVRSSVLVPVEFRLKMADPDTWLMQVLIIQRKLEREFNKEQVEELYSLYKQFIYSTRREHKVEMNTYIEDAVSDGVREMWKGYWHKYPAAILLFVDIITRFPDSFVSLRAAADLKSFLDVESIVMRHSLAASQSDTLLARLNAFIKGLDY